MGILVSIFSCKRYFGEASMIRLKNVKIPISGTDNDILRAIRNKLCVKQSEIISYSVFRRSVDARNKSKICFVYTFDINLNTDEEKIVLNCSDAEIAVKNEYTYFVPKNMPTSRPIIVGAGPAGLFCAFILAKSGFAPIVIERGKTVEERIKSVEKLKNERILDTESNIQFGEGGAGTFSDGKLTTGIKDTRISFILKTFVDFGAPKEILYEQKPHIGTDILRQVVVNMRKAIIDLGGEFRFNTAFTQVNHIGNTVHSVSLKNNGIEYELECDNLVLALGHSARDTFFALFNNGIEMCQKPFSVGARIEHKQKFINRSQYGDNAKLPPLPVADYKLAVRTNNGRSLYTFCMCPGGEVVAATSEEYSVVTNGMSNYARNGENANSALLVNVEPSDFDSGHPLAGIEFQRKIERAAFVAAGSNYNAPIISLGKLLYNKNSSSDITPSYLPGVCECDFSEFMPSFVINTMKEGLLLMDKKIKGFAQDGAVLTGPETRSSSPVRILRNENLQSNICGIYPCGEGAGYAGGITSAAADGIKCAEQILKSFIN